MCILFDNFYFLFLQETKLQILKFDYSWADEVERHERMVEIGIQNIISLLDNRLFGSLWESQN
jgi:hypothetical protein